MWVNDPAEAQSQTIQPTKLWERWAGRESGACPFGFGFRPTALQPGIVPFSSWEYRPPYLPEPLCFHIGTNIDVLTEPMLFYLSFARQPDSYSNAKRPPLEHKAGLREITRVEFVTPHLDNASPELQAVRRAGLVRLREGAEYLLELGFDRELKRQMADFRPALPLVFHW